MKKFRISSGAKRYLANTNWLFVDKIFRLFISLSVGIFVARYLGPSDYGLLNYAWSFVILFSAFATLGLDNIVVRNLVKNEKDRDELLGAAFVLKLAGSFLLLGILVVVVQFTANDSFTNLLIFIIAIAAIFQSLNAIDFYFQSKVLVKYAVFARTLSLFSSAIIKLLLIYLNMGLIYFAAVFVIENIIMAAGLLVMYRKQKLNIFHWRVKLGWMRNILKDSWPLMLSGLAVSVYMRIDQVMIKAFLSPEAVGNYAVAVRLSEAWYFIPAAVTTSVFPAIVEAKKKSQELYTMRLQKLYTSMTWAALGIAIPFTFLADDIVRILFGLQFEHTASVLRIYIWAGVFVFLGRASSQYLVAENFTKISFVRTFVGMIVNVALNLIMIPRYGINGAALATVTSYFIATFFIACIPKTRRQSVLMLKSFNLSYVFRDKITV